MDLQSVQFTVDFEPIGRRGQARAGDTLLSAAQSAGVELISLCGGVGACDSCRIRLVTGELSPPTLVEEGLFSAGELDEGWRLACQAELRSHVKVDVPSESLTTPQRLQIEGDLAALVLAPAVRGVDLIVPPPDLHDLRDDVTRLREAWREQEKGETDLLFSLPVLQTLSVRLRQYNWQVRLIIHAHHNGEHVTTPNDVHTEVIDLLPLDTVLCGLAVDIGTTSIAAYLVSLNRVRFWPRPGP